MKKIIALTLALALSMSVLVGCSKDDSSSQSEAPAYDLAKVLETIETAAPVRMSTPVDDEYLSYVGLDSALYDTYAGSYCPVTPGVDIILVVKAKSDKVSDVQAVLESHRESVYKANENYVGALKDKAQAGRVVTKGDYFVLVIAGDETVVEDQGVEKAYEPIDTAIDEAFK